MSLVNNHKKRRSYSDSKPLFNCLFWTEIVTTKRLNNQISSLKNEKFKIETKFNLLKSIVAKAVEMDKSNLCFRKSLTSASEQIHNSNPPNLDADTRKLLETYMKEEDLDSDFVKAQMDSAILKSIVNPLELELEDLRKKVKLYEYQLNITEELKRVNKKAHVEKCDVSKLIQKYRIDEHQSDSYNFCKLVAILSDMATTVNEKYDFHMYATALLNNNETISEQNETLKKSAKKLQSELNNEKEKYKDLQNTWKKANENFVEQSINMVKQLEDMRLHTPQINHSISDKTLLTHSPTIFEEEANNEIDNLIKTLENDKKKLHKKLYALKNENTNLHDAILRHKANMAEVVAQLNIANKQVSELTEKHQGEYAKLETMLIGLENSIPEQLKRRNTNISFTQDLFDPLGAATNATPNFDDSFNQLSETFSKSKESQEQIQSSTILNDHLRATSFDNSHIAPLRHALSSDASQCNYSPHVTMTKKKPLSMSQQIRPSSETTDPFGDLLTDFHGKLGTDNNKPLHSPKFTKDKKL